DKSVVVCGDQSGLDYEALLRVRPTHIITEWGLRDLPPRLLELARRNGWVQKNYPLLTLDDILTSTRELAALFGPAAGSAEPVVAATQKAWEPHPGRFAGAGRVLLLESIDPPAALGPGSFHQQILERLGGTPAITEGRPFITMDLESVARL